MSDLSPMVLGKYNLISLIGHGGMANVYKGHHPDLDRQVAIKVLHTPLQKQEDFIARFRQEAKAVANLHHPHIVQIYDIDTVDDFYFLVMELVNGPTLESEILKRFKANKGFALSEVSRIFGQLTDAVGYAHQQGIIHRDLKPSNIMFRSDGVLVLTDFGIARLLDVTKLTESGVLMGTYSYMSPEQCQGQPADGRSDIYSLGVILYKMLTGKVPFDAEQPIGLLFKHINDPPPPPNLINPSLPIPVSSVVLKALNKNPEDRYQTAKQMMRALQAAFSEYGEVNFEIDNLADQSAANRMPDTPVLFKQPGIQEQISSTGTTRGIPFEILNELRNTLLNCGPFETMQELNALFVDDRLFIWHDHLPEADSPAERVDVVIEFLFTRFSAANENALLLFLQVLVDRVNPQDSCWQKLQSLIDWLHQEVSEEPVRTESNVDGNSVAIVVYNEPGVFERPPELFGREVLMQQLRLLIKDRQNLLLQGLAGSGKTALAATIADELLEEKDHTLIWMQVGQGDFNAIVDALVDQLAENPQEKQEIRSATGNNQLMKIRDLLTRISVTMMVLDDVWQGDALQIIRAIPRKMATIVTSRQRYPKLHIVEVGNLRSDDAIDLLAYHSELNDLHKDQYALQLCETLGFHAYALEISGNVLRVDSQTPKQLLASLKDTPHKIRMPEGGAESGRDSVEALLESSFQLLTETQKSVFLTIGYLFAPGATVNLLNQFISLDPQSLNQALVTLVRRGLFKQRLIGEDGISFYSVHDLTFYFARTKARRLNGVNNEDRITGILNYLIKNSQKYDLLELDLPNILGAAKGATKLFPDHLIKIMSWLCVGGFPSPKAFSYQDVRGYTLAMLRRLDEASQAAQQMSMIEILHYLWTKRGNAYLDRYEFEFAAEMYKNAAEISPNKERKIKLISLLGKAHSFNGDDEKASQYFTEAEQLAADSPLIEFVIGQQAHAAGRKGDYVAAEKLANKQEEINRNLLAQFDENLDTEGNRVDALRGLFRALINKGSARLKSQVGTPNDILAIHEEAREIAAELENDEMLAHAHLALAEDYHSMNQREEAQIHIANAYDLFTHQEKTRDAQEVIKFAEQYNYQLLDDN